MAEGEIPTEATEDSPEEPHPDGPVFDRRRSTARFRWRPPTHAGVLGLSHEAASGIGTSVPDSPGSAGAAMRELRLRRRAPNASSTPGGGWLSGHRRRLDEPDGGRRYDRAVAATTPETYLADLNPAQREAVLHDRRPGARRRRRRLREDARAHAPHRAPARRGRRQAARDPRDHVHEQGGRGDARARRAISSARPRAPPG